MSKDAMLPCLVCGTTLRNAFDEQVNQPSEGTEFSTYGHYGSTFWDAFEGEQLVINVCDECLKTRTDRIGRQKRYRRILCEEPTRGGIRASYTVGRQWVHHEMVPWFDGPEDVDPINIEPEEIGTLTGYGRIEWVENWREIKQDIMTARAIEEDADPCLHTRFVAECTDCGARPLQGLR